MNLVVKIRLVASAIIAVVGTSAHGADESTLFGPPSRIVGEPRLDTVDGELNAIQLAGISTLGGQSMFNLVDSRNNKSFWVTMKGTANGFTVDSYDAATDTVVIGYNGRTRPLKLRQAKIASMPTGPAMPAPVPVRAVATGPQPAVIHTPNGAEISNPKTPQEIAQAETEARNLVSDLLEISMQERARQKALREAAQKQQGGSPPPAP